MSSRRGAGRVNRGVSRAVRSYVRRQDRMVAYGERLYPGPYPGALVEQPWNSAVIQLGGLGDSDITIQSIHDQLVKQLGLITYDTSKIQTGIVDVDLRPTSIRAWALKADRPISLSVIGFTEDASQPSQIFTCWPGAQRLPSVGYKWPQFVNSGLFNTPTDNANRLARVDVGGSNAWLVYFDVLWRSASHLAISERVNYSSSIVAQVTSLCLE